MSRDNSYVRNLVKIDQFIWSSLRAGYIHRGLINWRFGDGCKYPMTFFTNKYIFITITLIYAPREININKK